VHTKHCLFASGVTQQQVTFQKIQNTNGVNVFIKLLGGTCDLCS